jgi:anion-transporting  ArsA/GET3 family ATPase
MPAPRLHVVTGKGGTGKTTVAAALALALASEPDRRVLLAEVEGRQGLAQLFDRAPLGSEPDSLATAPGGGEVSGLAVDVEHAFMSYVERVAGQLRRTRPLLRRFGVVEFATQVMPGLRDLLLVDPVVAAASERRGRGMRWDAVVMDAPPTGRITRFLSVAEEVGSLAKVGGFASQAQRVMALLRSPATAVHLVSLLEPMPVQETEDAAVELAASGFRLGLVVVNLARTGGLTAEDLDAAGGVGLDAERLGRAAAKAGLDLDDATVDGLIDEAAAHARRLRLEAGEREALSKVGRPVAELPRLADGVDLGGLYQLAETLRPALSAVSP